MKTIWIKFLSSWTTGVQVVIALKNLTDSNLYVSV